MAQKVQHVHTNIPLLIAHFVNVLFNEKCILGVFKFIEYFTVSLFRILQMKARESLYHNLVIYLNTGCDVDEKFYLSYCH